MHQEVRQGLEEYLAGRQADPIFDSHLRGCPACREELGEISRLSRMVGCLRAEAEVGVAPGFYARLSEHIARQRPVSLWSLMLEPAFGRRIVFASLMLLAVLGTYLVSAEREPYFAAPNPEFVMALEEDSPVIENARLPDRDMMLVTLATYQP
jgi:anti-sigma factor RsiW